MKDVFVGFALDPVAETVVACSVKASHSDCVEFTAAQAGNKLQRVFNLCSVEFLQDLREWLVDSGVSDREAMQCCKSFIAQLKAGLQRLP